MESEKFDQKVLEDVIGSLLEEADKEIKASQDYKDLFGHGSSLPSIVSGLENKMLGPVFAAIEVIKAKLGRGVTNEGYHFLLAVPIISHLLEEKIKEEEGSACCVDKTHYIMGKMLEKKLKPKT